MNIIGTHCSNASAHICPKYGAGKGNRTPVLSLEGSCGQPYPPVSIQLCADIPCPFTHNGFNSLRGGRHTFRTADAPA